MQIDLIYSQRDGLYYAEIWDRDTGDELHTTNGFRTQRLAKESAERWINETFCRGKAAAL